MSMSKEIASRHANLCKSLSESLRFLLYKIVLKNKNFTNNVMIVFDESSNPFTDDAIDWVTLTFKRKQSINNKMVWTKTRIRQMVCDRFRDMCLHAPSHNLQITSSGYLSRSTTIYVTYLINKKEWVKSKQHKVADTIKAGDWAEKKTKDVNDKSKSSRLDRFWKYEDGKMPGERKTDTKTEERGNENQREILTYRDRWREWKTDKQWETIGAWSHT